MNISNFGNTVSSKFERVLGVRCSLAGLDGNEGTIESLGP